MENNQVEITEKLPQELPQEFTEKASLELKEEPQKELPADSESLEASEDVLPENLVTDESEILRTLEALVFTSPKALSLKRIKAILSSFNYDTRNVPELLQVLMKEYENRGFQLVKVAGAYQFRSHPSQSEVLQKLLEDRPVRLSPSALEVLAIVAYKQPISRAEIDVIRGVDSGHLTRGLLEKNLIRTLGHAETPGRPLLYGTTQHFLEVFSLDSLDDLPSLEEFDRELANKSKAENSGDEEATIFNADPEGLEQAALFHDRASPLAAEPDRGSFDEPLEEFEERADFGVAERALEENIQ
jgi:segregation and condensation protein B